MNPKLVFYVLSKSAFQHLQVFLKVYFAQLIDVKYKVHFIKFIDIYMKKFWVLENIRWNDIKQVDLLKDY